MSQCFTFAPQVSERQGQKGLNGSVKFVRSGIGFRTEDAFGRRWLAEVSQLPGALAYGDSANEAMARAEALALRAFAEQLEHGEALPAEFSIRLPAAA